MASIWSELRRRNVFRVGIAFLAASWLLIQVADVVLSNFAAPAWIIQALIFSLALSFPFVLALAWFYELTPEGVKSASELKVVEGVKFTGRKLDFVIIGMLVLAVGFLLGRDYVLDRPGDLVLTDENQPSIAVLPFANMSDDASNEYFSDGISEEVLNLLAGISELRVISRSSAFSFKGKNAPIPLIAEQLNVAHVLEGSVRKAGNTVRITAQLIEANTDTHLWSETYDRELDDIFAIQDEIAATVVEKLRLTLLGEAPYSQPIDPAAYSLFLQARHVRRLQTADSLREAERLYKQSLALEPNYVPNWIGLSAVYDNQILTSLLPAEEGYALAQEAVDRALEIDPESAAALDSLGWIVDRRDNSLAQAASYVRRALELESHDLDVLASAARVLTSLGRLDEATVIREYVVARDPLNPIRHNNLGALKIYNRNYAEAKINMSRILEISPDYLGGRFFVGLTDLLMGDAEAALGHFDQETDDSWRLKGQALANFSLGRHEDANAALAKLIEIAGEQWPTDVAHVYAYWNDLGNAFKWLEYDLENPGGWGEGRLDPLFDNLHADPRWQAHLEKLGVSDAQLVQIDFDVTLSAGVIP